MNAFTLTELLVVLGVLSVLIAIVIPVMSRVRRSSSQVKCLSNLRQLVVGFVVYAADNRGALPDPGSAQVSWESMLLPKVPNRSVFRCPADEELYPTIESSYDWRDTGDPQTTISGWKLVAVPATVVITFDSLPGWHAKQQMNAAMPDGSAKAMTDRECLLNLSTPVRSTQPSTTNSGRQR